MKQWIVLAVVLCASGCVVDVNPPPIPVPPPAPKPAHSKEWEEGYKAWRRWRMPQRLVPYEDGQKRKDWLDGWMARSIEERTKP